MSYFCMGFFEKAEEHLLKAVDFSQKINPFSYAGGANFLLGETYFARGDHKAAKGHHERSISFFQRCRVYPSFVNVNRISIARAKVMNKEKDINLNDIFKWHEDIKIKRVEGRVSNYIMTILLNVDDQHLSEAEDWIKNAIETDQKYGMMWCLANDYAQYADLFKRKGDLPKARENLNKAIEIYKECGADGFLKKAEKELAALS